MASMTLGTGEAALNVSPIGYGAMGLTAFYGDTTPEKDALVVLRKAYDLGVRHFDTAQVYAQKGKDGEMHYNEELLGKFLSTLSEEERKDVSVATKFYPVLGWSKEAFTEATLASKKRLGVEKIDLYYFHRVIGGAEVEEWMGVAKDMIGKHILRIGLSEAPPNVIRKAHKVHPITCVQQEWSLFARDLETDIVPTCQELGIGIVSYSPIGRGFLAGRFVKKEDRPQDWRATVPYLAEENIEKNLALLEEFKSFAAEKKCTVGQLALAWVMAKGGVPIPGTTKINHLEDNMGAMNVKLDADDIKRLGDLGDKVTGARGDESYMQSTFQVHEKL